jgi:cytochrome c oxidase subunit 2
MKSIANIGCVVCALLFFIALPLLGLGAEETGALGEQARKSWQEMQNTPIPAEPTNISSVVWWVVILLSLLIVLTLTLILQASKLSGFDPFAKLNRNQVMALSWIIIPAILIGFLIWHIYEHTRFLLPSAASEHGDTIDFMLYITLGITGFVFVAVHLLLFYYVYTYRGRPGNVALFYPDNHRLEQVLTIIPAVVLTTLVIGGVNAWNRYNEKPKDNPLNLELVAMQFNWTVRYGGPDNKLGPAYFHALSGQNALGVDFRQPSAKDDIIPAAKEIHLPVNRPVIFNVRAKDVLHGVYFPHFRAQIYAVPGMPTQLFFKPIMTTKQMREKTGNPDFNYELACSQLCGSAHYNMRMVVVVHEEKEWEEWLKTQKPYLNNDNQEKLFKELEEQNKKFKFSSSETVIDQKASL